MSEITTLSVRNPDRPRPAVSWVARNALIVASLMLFAGAPFFLESYLVGELTRALIYGIAACSVGFLVGRGGLVSFGHAAYFGIGAYTVLVAHLNGWNEALIVWPMAMVFAALAGCVFGALALRTRAVAFIMVTLAFAQMLFYLAIGLRGIGGADGLAIASRNTLAGASLSSTAIFHFVVLAITALVVAVFVAMRLTAFGLALEAIRQNERRVNAVGLAAHWIQYAAFVVSAAVCGLAGALIANQYLFVSPAQLHWIVSGDFLVMATLGGLGMVAGGIYGALVLLLTELVFSHFTTYWRIFIGPLVILAVLFLHDGIGPGLQRLLGGRRG